MAMNTARWRTAANPSRSWLRIAGLGLGSFLALVFSAGAGEFRLAPTQPTLDRWNYPFSWEASRPVAPTYGAFDPRFDTRDAELLLGWDTASALATNAGPARYLIRRARVTLTSVAPIPPTLSFVYDPTYDSYRTYLKPGPDAPDALPDEDPGRPIELYGVGFRGGFTAETFLEGSPFGPLGPTDSGNISIGTRNAFGIMFDENGLPIDVANNVGQRNPAWTNAPFEVRPWAVGTTTNTLPGGEMPDDARMTFEIDLSDPWVTGYLQKALNDGRLRLMVSSLSPAGQSTPGGTGGGGAGAYPWWANKENLLYDAPKLELEGVLVSDEDTDVDGLPDDWERFQFGDLTATADADADADGDGASNREEQRAGTNPTLASDVLRIRSWGRSPEGELWLSFPVAPSREYAVEISGDLAAWTPLAGRLTYPEPGFAVWRGEQPLPAPPGGAGFVRIAVR